MKSSSAPAGVPGNSARYGKFLLLAALLVLPLAIAACFSAKPRAPESLPSISTRQAVLAVPPIVPEPAAPAPEPPPVTETAAAAPAVFPPVAGLSPRVLSMALDAAACARERGVAGRSDVLTIVDYSRP